MKLTAQEKRLLKTHKLNYKLHLGMLYGQPKLELWKKNPKGFYNVVCYLDSEDDMDKAILNDLKRKRK